MNLEILDPESQQLYTELKATVIAHAEKVAITFDALVRIRDGRLYRAEFKTFDAFCESVGMNTRKAYRLLEEKAKKPKRIASEKTELKNGILVRHTGQKITPEAVADALNGPIYSGPVTPPEELAEHVAADASFVITPETPEAKVAAMMQKLSLKPVIDVRAEQYRTHTPIPPMDRPEEKLDTIVASHTESFFAIARQDKEDKEIASTELKAWAVKRRAMNDATSEDDAAWAIYIAQQIIL